MPFEVPDEQFVRAVLAWRALRPKLVAHFKGGAAEAFDFLDVHREGSISLAVWVKRFQSLGLVEREEAVSLFGLVVAFKHSHWNHGVRSSPSIGWNMFVTALRRAEPVSTMSHLHKRLSAELCSMLSAFEYIAGGDDISYDKWVRALRRFWVTSAEATHMFALLEYDSNGLVSQKCFTKAMRKTDGIMALKEVCHKMVRQHGMVSRTFEGVDLAAPLTNIEFVAACTQVLGIGEDDARAMWGCLHHGPKHTVQLAGLLDSLTSIEEQHYRFHVPFHIVQAEPMYDGQKPDEVVQGSVSPSLRRPPQHVALPALSLSTLLEAASGTPPGFTPQSSSARERVRLEDAKGYVQLPALPQSARASVGEQHHTESGDVEADRLKRIEEWKKHLPKHRVMQRTLREQASGSLDRAAVETLKQELLEMSGEKESEAFGVVGKQDSATSRTKQKFAKEFLQ